MALLSLAVVIFSVACLLVAELAIADCEPLEPEKRPL